MKSVVIGCLAVAALLVGTGKVQAFSLDPAIVDVSISPGKAYTSSIQIKNDEAVAQTYYLAIQKFISSGQAGQQEYLPLTDVAGLPSWIYLTSPSVRLEPGEVKDVVYTIRVPENAPIGGHYGTIFFSTVPPLVDLDASMAGARTGTLVLLTVEGQVVQKMRVKDFLLRSAKSTNRLPALFSVTVANEGNVHLAVEGTVTVKNMFGQTVSRIPLRKFGARALPGSERELALSWMKEMPREGSGFWHELGEEWRNFAIGHYTLTLDLEGPGTAGLVSQVINVSIWPWRLFVVFGLAIVTVIILLAWYKRVVLHRAVRSHERGKTS